jgi:hypothetical protein
VLERLALRELVAHRPIRGRVGGIVRVLQHEHRRLGAVDELFDQRAPVLFHHEPRLLEQRVGRLRARLARETDARVAARVLGDEREAERFGRPLEVPFVGSDDVAGRVDPPRPAHALHRLARGLVELRGRAGERKPQPLEREHDVDAGASLVPRAVAQVEEQVVAVAGELDHPLHGVRRLDHPDVPPGLGEEGPRVAGPVVLREENIEVLLGQQADVHVGSAVVFHRARERVIHRVRRAVSTRRSTS